MEIECNSCHSNLFFLEPKGNKVACRCGDCGKIIVFKNNNGWRFTEFELPIRDDLILVLIKRNTPITEDKEIFLSLARFDKNKMEFISLDKKTSWNFNEVFCWQAIELPTSLTL